MVTVQDLIRADAAKQDLLCAERLSDDERKDTGFAIGWDAYCSQIGELEGGDQFVRDGYAAAAAHFEGWKNIRRPDRFDRKHVYLRFSAYKRGLPFDPSLTPSFLVSIDRAFCPVTLDPLTHCTLGLTDASVDRIENRMPYEVGNVAILSARVNKIKDTLSADAIVSIAKTGREIDGLSAPQWRRLAAICVGTHNKLLPASERLRVPMVTAPPPLTYMTAFETMQVDLVCKSAAGEKRPWRRYLEPRSVKGQAHYLRLCNKLHHRLSEVTWFLSVWEDAELYGLYCDWFDILVAERPDTMAHLKDLINPPNSMPEEGSMSWYTKDEIDKWRRQMKNRRLDLARSLARSVDSYKGLAVEGESRRRALACSGAVLSALGVVQ
ncbi:MAG: hypothetical protein LW865_02135 [Betaproteobacteria bacterium]|jgi:hypothetical protein|nr:hypothetical protein [Betaproteobacteria bacterium]